MNPYDLNEIAKWQRKCQEDRDRKEKEERERRWKFIYYPWHKSDV